MQPIPRQDGREIVVQLDWGNQTNGSYLTGGVVLSPHVIQGNPLTTDDWLAVTYVGVPPGRNGRLVVAVKSRGRERTVENGGLAGHRPRRSPARHPARAAALPQPRRRGLGRGRRVWTSEADALVFGTAYLYLQMSSHSNYPPRAIYFDTIRID